MTDETPAPILRAREASEAIRTINHLTIHGDGGLEYPDDLGQTVAALAEMLERLPQAIGQVARITRRLQVDPRLYDDRDWDHDVTARQALGALDSVTVTIGTPAAALRSAADLLSHLGVRDG